MGHLCLRPNEPRITWDPMTQWVRGHWTLYRTHMGLLDLWGTGSISPSLMNLGHLGLSFPKSVSENSGICSEKLSGIWKGAPSISSHRFLKNF